RQGSPLARLKHCEEDGARMIHSVANLVTKEHPCQDARRLRDPHLVFHKGLSRVPTEGRAWSRLTCFIGCGERGFTSYCRRPLHWQAVPASRLPSGPKSIS